MNMFNLFLRLPGVPKFSLLLPITQIVVSFLAASILLSQDVSERIPYLKDLFFKQQYIVELHSDVLNKDEVDRWRRHTFEGIISVEDGAKTSEALFFQYFAGKIKKDDVVDVGIVLQSVKSFSTAGPEWFRQDLYELSSEWFLSNLRSETEAILGKRKISGEALGDFALLSRVGIMLFAGNARNPAEAEFRKEVIKLALGLKENVGGGVEKDLREMIFQLTPPAVGQSNFDVFFGFFMNVGRHLESDMRENSEVYFDEYIALIDYLAQDAKLTEGQIEEILDELGKGSIASSEGDSIRGGVFSKAEDDWDNLVVEQLVQTIATPNLIAFGNEFLRKHGSSLDKELRQQLINTFLQRTE